MRIERPWSVIRFSCLLLAIQSISFVSNAFAQDADSQPNILFISVDDLNHWVGHLDGHPGTYTPNIDRLARQGISFRRAYSAAPLCNPSRAALMTGIMPARSGVYGNGEQLRSLLPDAVTLPQYFRQHGYRTIGGGKTFHRIGPGDPDSWDEYISTQRSLPAVPRPEDTPTDMWLNWGATDQREESFMEAQVAEGVIEQLQSEHEKPFFIAYGLFKPHLPWVVPQAYFDLHPPNSIVLPDVLEDDLDDVPNFGRKLAAEVFDVSGNRNFAAEGGDHANILRYNQWHAAVRSYLASISFADAQVGKVLDALAQSRYADNTIVVLWGDHGYHLGQKSHWRKHTLWEDALRTTLIIAAPDTDVQNALSNRVVSLIDLYPTLVDLAGLPMREGLDGQSLMPLLHQPDREWRRPALSTFGFQNHSVRSERWRYIRYHDGGEELYDHESDPNEWYNLAIDSKRESYSAVIDELAQWLPVGNKLP